MFRFDRVCLLGILFPIEIEIQEVRVWVDIVDRRKPRRPCTFNDARINRSGAVRRDNILPTSPVKDVLDVRASVFKQDRRASREAFTKCAGLFIDLEKVFQSLMKFELIICDIGFIGKQKKLPQEE
jgi:hypothetical protein